MKTPEEPTSEQCSNRARLSDFKGWRAYACWYPQMGGYTSRAVVLVPQSKDQDEDGPCFEAYVWHDGEFPFGDDDARGPVRHIHHCNPAQFIDFGEWVRRVAAEDDS